jgi:hypothetical protein
MINLENEMNWTLYRFNNFTNRAMYVSERPGEGGVDWGYTDTQAKAAPLNDYWRKRFCADMGRCNTVGFAIPAAEKIAV